MTQKPSFIQNSILTLLTCTFSNLCHAELAFESELSNQTHSIKSIQNLESLKNISSLEHLNTPEVHELQNRFGVRSLFVETPTLPMVDIQLSFNAGSARDEEIGKGLNGLATLAARLIQEGTTQYSANEIADKLDALGAQFSAYAQRDMFIVRLRVRSDIQKLDQAILLMLELINNAQFEKSSLERAQSSVQIGQKQQIKNPSRLINTRFYRAVYGKHPYAEPITGTVATNQRIQPEMIRQFRDQFLVAQNLNIAITGQLKHRQAQMIAEQISGELPQGEVAKPLPNASIKSGFQIIHWPFHTEQAHVMMGHLGPKRATKERIALEVANRMFGGSGFNAVLMQELRLKRGLTYSAYSGYSFTQAPGIFNMSFSTKQEQLIPSIQVAHQALVNFVQQPIDQTLLEETKSGMLRALPNSYSKNADLNARLGSIGFYKEPTDYLSRYITELEKINAQEVQQAIQKYMHPDRLTLVILSQKLDQNALKLMLNQNLRNTPNKTSGLIEIEY